MGNVVDKLDLVFDLNFCFSGPLQKDLCHSLVKWGRSTIHKKSLTPQLVGGTEGEGEEDTNEQTIPTTDAHFIAGFERSKLYVRKCYADIWALIGSRLPLWQAYKSNKGGQPQAQGYKPTSS